MSKGKKEKIENESSPAIQYYDWLFFKDDGMLHKWIQRKGMDEGLQSLDDYFRLCLLLVGGDSGDLDGLDSHQTQCFKERMWAVGWKRLAIGLRVEVGVDEDLVTPHMIKELTSKTHFTDEEGDQIPYVQIKRIVTIPEIVPYSKDNIKVGMKLRLKNKRFTGNIYTVTAVHKKGFDAQNGKYLFSLLEYDSIAKVLGGGDVVDNKTKKFIHPKKPTKNKTTVANVCVKNIRPKYKNLQEWMANPNNVYIGRAGIVFIDKKRFPPKASKFANPFKLDKNGDRDKCLQWYRKYIEKQLETGKIKKEEILALKGKNLGCWCHPEPCHGDVLVEMIDRLDDEVELLE